MLQRTWYFPFAIAAAACVLLAGYAAAVAPEIKDDGKFFSPETVKKANEQIREIAQKYDKDILVETFPTVPADKAEKFKEMSREDRTKFIHSWAKERADYAAVNGIYILICKEPTQVRVELRSKGKSPLTTQVTRKLGEMLVEEFRGKHFDEGLLKGVKFVREKLADKAPMK